MTSRAENAERQRLHYERMKERGLVKTSVYVPAKSVERLRAYAKRLRKEVGEST